MTGPLDDLDVLLDQRRAADLRRREYALAGLAALLFVAACFAGLWVLTTYAETIREFARTLVGGGS